MEYIFGIIHKRGKDIHILKTVGSEHTNYVGAHSIERRYSDSIITDNFIVVEKYLSKDGADGKCYDWYELKEHSRYIDYFTPLKEEIQIGISDSQNATCELSEEMDIEMSDLENAICEQSEMIEQALSDIENALCELTEE